MREYIEGLLLCLAELSGPHRKFMISLFLSMMSFTGRANRTNLSRYGGPSVRSQGRWARRPFPFAALNVAALSSRGVLERELIGVIDESFVEKAGKKTHGRGWFYDGCMGIPRKGLALSLFAVVDLEQKTAYAIEARQLTPKEHPSSTDAPDGAKHKKDTAKTARKSGRRGKNAEKVDKPGKSAKRAATGHGKSSKKVKKSKRPLTAAVKETRVDEALHQYQEVRPLLPELDAIVVDSAYAKERFVTEIIKNGDVVISKLRRDAALRYLYTGPRGSGRGRSKKYDGKVIFSEMERWGCLGRMEEGVQMFTAVVWSDRLKRAIRVVRLVPDTARRPADHILLFCSDVRFDPHEILRLYRARFQIEFLFRDARQHTGLDDGQARDKDAIQFHFNLAFSTLNFLKFEEVLRGGESLSIESARRRKHNQNLVSQFIALSDIDPMAQKVIDAQRELASYGCLAA